MTKGLKPLFLFKKLDAKYLHSKLNWRIYCYSCWICKKNVKIETFTGHKFLLFDAGVM